MLLISVLPTTFTCTGTAYSERQQKLLILPFIAQCDTSSKTGSSDRRLRPGPQEPYTYPFSTLHHSSLHRASQWQVPAKRPATVPGTLWCASLAPFQALAWPPMQRTYCPVSAPLLPDALPVWQGLSPPQGMLTLLAVKTEMVLAWVL